MHKIEIELPFVVHASDYHEFTFMQDWIRFILDDFKIKIEEVDFDEDTKQYRAIVFKGRYPSKSVIEQAKNATTAKLDKYYKFMKKQEKK